MEKTDLPKGEDWYIEEWYGSYALVTTSYDYCEEGFEELSKLMDESFPHGHLAMVKDGSLWEEWFIGHNDTSYHRRSGGETVHVGTIDLYRGGESWSSSHCGSIIPVWKPTISRSSYKGNGWQYYNDICSEFYASGKNKEFYLKYGDRRDKEIRGLI